MDQHEGVLVHCEKSEGRLTSIAAELLGCGRRLADDLGESLNAVLIGGEMKGLANEAIMMGADKVFVAEHPLLKDDQVDACLVAMETVVKEVRPQIFLMGQTSVGRDLGPRLAFRLNTAVIMDCVDLAIDPESKLLLQTRPVFGGNAQATFVCESFPQIATVRAKTMSAATADSSREGEVVSVAPSIESVAMRTTLLDRVKEDAPGIKLEDADVVVCGGRGIGGPEGFEELKKFAMVVRGAVGATRPPCDNGWVSPGLQIGLTGKIVSPQTYIGVAVSGSSQHLTGCCGAKDIVAINKDPEANIFKVARFGVVGDWKRVITGFMKALSG